MRAMLLDRIRSMKETVHPLRPCTVDDPVPGPTEVLLAVSTCGVCHTDLDIIEGRTPPARLPMILGHQVVGRVVGGGKEATRFSLGTRVGVAWIHSSCGRCGWCVSGRENLCPDFEATGRDAPGGYAERMVVDQAYAYPLPDTIADEEAAPLLCAGAVGLRSVRLCGIEDGAPVGLTGFGASGHLVLQMLRVLYPNSPTAVFARNPQQRALAETLGADWTGDTDAAAPTPLQAIIDTTPAWTPVVRALENLCPGGRLVINAIRKTDRDKAVLSALSYERHLWMEKSIQSVANVTRDDVAGVLGLAGEYPLKVTVRTFTLEDADQALHGLLEHGAGAIVLNVG